MTELLSACFKCALWHCAVQMKSTVATGLANAWCWKLLPPVQRQHWWLHEMRTRICVTKTQTLRGTVTTSLDFLFFYQHKQLDHERLLLVFYRSPLCTSSCVYCLHQLKKCSRIFSSLDAECRYHFSQRKLTVSLLPFSSTYTHIKGPILSRSAPGPACRLQTGLLSPVAGPDQRRHVRCGAVQSSAGSRRPVPAVCMRADRSLMDLCQRWHKFCSCHTVWGMSSRPLPALLTVNHLS